MLILSCKTEELAELFFPRGIGRRGKIDQEWRSHYAIPLRDFAHQLDLNNIQVLLLEQEEKKNVGKACGDVSASAEASVTTEL